MRGGREITVALIAAGSAVLGAAVSGFAIYWGNRALQDRADLATARGIARVYQSEFFDFGARLHAMLQQNILIAPTDQPFDLTTEDKKVLAAHESPTAWATVADAEAALRIFDNPNDLDYKKAEAGLTVRLEPLRRKYVADNLHAVDLAIDALAPLAGQAAKP